jgi:hypothetical protein
MRRVRALQRNYSFQSSLAGAGQSNGVYGKARL